MSKGSTSAQLRDEVSALSQDERQELIASGDFAVPIQAEDALAMKADLVIPWKKVRVMRR